MPELLSDVDRFPRTAVLTPRVHRVLGLNPSAFTGPGTNTYIVGADGPEPLLIDTGSGVAEYAALLQEHWGTAALAPLTRILLTHVHPDHIGGAKDVHGALGAVPVHKHPWPGKDERWELALETMGDGDTVSGPGYTLRALHTPGHAQDHLCFYLEEERALFTGDVILGVGTTVIPQEGGDLGDYLDTLRRLQALDLARIYPGHGPVIDTPAEKIAAYLEHRLMRERQVLTELEPGPKSAVEIVAVIYRDYPAHLHGAAAQSITSHLLKLEKDGRVAREANGGDVKAMRFRALKAEAAS